MSAELLMAAFVAGTALSATAGTLAESRMQASACLDRPFVDSQQILKSLGRVLLAGPYLLVGEAIAARAQARCSMPIWTITVLFAALWCLCIGILALEMGATLIILAGTAVETGGLPNGSL
ncbi:MAG: hypothetical protein WCC66_00085 [Rhizobiaceae bacterium]